MPPGTLYRVTLVRTDVSDKVSSPSLGFVSVIGYYNSVTVEILLLDFSIERYCLWSKVLEGICVNVVLSSQILFTLMMDVIHSSETSVTRATWRNTQEDGIHHSHRHEILKSYSLYYTSYLQVIN
jgi:hypothetical protein